MTKASFFTVHDGQKYDNSRSMVVIDELTRGGVWATVLMTPPDTPPRERTIALYDGPEKPQWVTKDTVSYEVTPYAVESATRISAFAVQILKDAKERLTTEFDPTLLDKHTPIVAEAERSLR